MSKAKLGFKAHLYFNVGGTYMTPTWVSIDNISDCAVVGDRDKIEVPMRLQTVKFKELGQLDLEITGKIRSDDSDTNGFITLETAFLTGSVIDVMVLDGDNTTNGNRGYRFDAKCFKFGEDQAIGAVLFREFELAPCISVNPPSKAVVATGAAVFTSL